MRQKVGHQNFLNRLNHELDELNRWGTSYRSETACLALEVAMRNFNPSLFLNRQASRKAVLQSNLNLDNHRLEDVSKMLYVLAGVMDGELNQTEEFKTRLSDRQGQMKQVRLVKLSK